MSSPGQRLELRIGTSLVMTPQLQQAIKLLQLSSVELQEYVERLTGRFDVVSMFHYLEHTPNPQQQITFRALKLRLFVESRLL